MSAQPLSERVLRVAQRPLGIRHDVQDKKPPQGSIVKHTCGYMNGDGPKPRCQCSSISSSEARMLVQAGWDWLRATRSNGSPYVFHGAIVPRQRPAPQLTPRKQEKTLAAVRRDLQLALAAGKNSEPPQSWKHNASRPSGSISQPVNGSWRGWSAFNAPAAGRRSGRGSNSEFYFERRQPSSTWSGERCKSRE